MKKFEVFFTYKGNGEEALSFLDVPGFYFNKPEILTTENKESLIEIISKRQGYDKLFEIFKINEVPFVQEIN